jgi:proliferating cell nuclear antigen
MSIDSEHVGIPDQPYDALLGLSSAEFSKIIRDLSALSETVSIHINEDSVKFNAAGDIGSGSIALKPTESVDKVRR